MKRMSKWMKTVLSLIMAIALVIPTTAYAAEEKYIEIYDDAVYMYVGNQWSFSYDVFPEGTGVIEDWTCTWETGDANVLEQVSEGIFEAVAAGTTTVTVTTESGLADTVSVTVLAPHKWDGEKTERVIFNTRFQERMFELTVPEDGLYEFTGEKIDDYSAEFVLFEGDDYSNPVAYFETYSGGVSQTYLEANKTYTLRCWAYGGSWAYDLTFREAVEEDNSANVEGLFRQDSVTISIGEMLYLPSFIQIEETVAFSSADESIVSLNVTSYDDVAVALATGNVVITAEAQDGERDTMEVKVVEQETFDMDSTKNITLGDGFLNKVYKITLEQDDDKYLMSYAEDGDSHGIIYDLQGNEVTRCDDYKNLNFGFDFAQENLPAGTYYLLISEYSFSNGDYHDSEAFDVEVIQGESVAADTVELSMDSPGNWFMIDDTYYIGSDAELYFNAEFGSSILAREEAWDVESDNTDVVYFDDQNDMWFTKDCGVATITVESENGLTDSVKVCVIDVFVVGDLNLDGVIGSADINLILGVINGTVEMKDIYYQAEVNGDNKIDVDDIAALVKSAELIKNPTKTTYTVGEAFDTAGMELKVTFVDGNVETVTDGFIVSGYDATKEGTQKVTISYGNETFPFEVTVVKASPATGDTTTYAWAIVMVLCAGYAVLAFKKRRNG